MFVAGPTTTIAFDVEFDDRRVMPQPVDGGDRHALVREHIVPAREGLVGRNQKAFTFISLRDQFEQHAGFGLILARVRQVIEDDEIGAIELREREW